jgi:hypothetical protein
MDEESETRRSMCNSTYQQQTSDFERLLSSDSQSVHTPHKTRADLPSIKHTASDTCLGKRRARGNCPACTHSGVANGDARTVFVATIHALLVCSNVKQQQGAAFSKLLL